MACAVIALSPREFLREDAGAISEICDRLGPDTAARVLARSIEDLALSVAAIATQVRLHDLADVQWHSRRVQKLALGLGLISLANVAGDLRRSHCDPTAFAAVCARLLRVASRSLVGLSRQWVAGR